MVDVKTIKLPPFEKGPLRFLRAERWDDQSRFVLIRYALEGKEEEFGLRLDLDKKIFLDHLPDPELDQLAQYLLKPTWGFIVKERAFAG
jgi:hypothetical protein